MNCNSNTMPLPTSSNDSCNLGCTPRDINVICKKMLIPQGQEIIGIQGEDNSNSRTFIIPKITDNGDDISEMGFTIITKDSEGKTTETIVDDLEFLENHIKIKWTLDKTKSIVPGKFYIEITAGKEDFLWKTYPGEFFISESIELDPIEEEIEESVVEELMRQIAINSTGVAESKQGVSELKEEKQDKLIAGDNIEITQDNKINVVGIAKAENDYTEINKISDYLYETYYSNIDYGYAYKYFKNQNEDISIGHCSSLRKGNLYGRNYDWTYSNQTEFIVKTPNYGNHYATLGVCGISSLTKDFVESGEYSESYKILPFYLNDGINECGVFCNVNVVPIGEIPMTETVPTISQDYEISNLMVTRFVLDNFKTALEAVKALKEHTKIYASKKFQKMGYEFHYMIGDSEETYVVEIIDNQVIYKKTNIMTNFNLNGVKFNSDNTVYTPKDMEEGHSAIIENHINKFGSGLERYNLIVKEYPFITDKSSMRTLLNKLMYTRAYPSCELPGGVSNPFWYSEFVGEFNGKEYTIDTLASEFDQDIIPSQDSLYVNRNRNLGNTWQTVHSSIYDIKEKKLYIVSQEENTEKEFSIGINKKVMEISDKSTDNEIPTAKAVYEYIQSILKK